MAKQTMCRRAPRRVLLAAVAVMLGATACADRPAAIDKVILVSIDTLRADYLGVYGGPEGLTPHFNAFAAESVVFEDAVTQATSTLPSHTSLFYSVHTFVHQAYVGNPPDPQLPMPVEVLRQAGFRTAALVGGGQLRSQFGLDRGFETYDVVNTRDLNEKTRGRDRLRGLLTGASRFLRQHGDEPFLLFLHTYEPHFPYDPPQQFIDDARALAVESPGISLQQPLVGFRPDMGVPAEAWVANDRRLLYAAEVRYVDDFFGRLMRRLEGLELDDEVAVVLVADHGESLGERGLLGHNLFTAEQLRVPLIMHVPGVAPSRIHAPVQLIDVMPTLFALLDQEEPYPFMGMDLSPLLVAGGGGDPDRLRFSENKGSAAVVQGPWKVIFPLDNHRDFQLFNLEQDPGELDDVAVDRPALAVRMIEEYERLVAQHGALGQLFPRASGDATQALDPETLRELRAMGYIQ